MYIDRTLCSRIIEHTLHKIRFLVTLPEPPLQLALATHHTLVSRNCASICSGPGYRCGKWILLFTKTLQRERRSGVRKHGQASGNKSEGEMGN